MKIFYTKKFSKDLDKITHDQQVKKSLLQFLEKVKQIDSLAELENVRKIRGYEGYYRIRIGDYRMGLKVTEKGIEMLRFLHRKDIYRRLP